MNPVAKVELYEYDCMGMQAELCIFTKAEECFVHLFDIFIYLVCFFGLIPWHFFLKYNYCL